MAQKTTIKGFSVIYDDNASSGVYYLRDSLDYNEAVIFFDRARNYGSADFEDHNGNNFTLVYQNGEYLLNQR